MLIDVRTADEFDISHVEGAMSIPLEQLRSSLDKIPKDKKVILCCQQGKKSYFAWRILSQNGYQHTYSLSGGLKLYLSATREAPTQTIHRDKTAQAVTSPVEEHTTSSENTTFIDAVGLSCPGPIMKIRKEIRTVDHGNKINVTASDPGFAKDIAIWCNKTGNILEECDTHNAITTVVIMKAC